MPVKSEKTRCRWCLSTPEELDYHDKEWGFPVGDDVVLFEKICLEGFQSGLSWRTILNKRENFRKAFCHFDFNKIAQFSERDIIRLLQNRGIVRHRGKIESVINNAQRMKELVKKEGSLASFVWKYEPDRKSLKPYPLPSTSTESVALSRDLKKLGWKFVGPTTVYAFMQAMGLVNDHAEECFMRPKAENARKKFRVPSSL